MPRDYYVFDQATPPSPFRRLFLLVLSLALVAAITITVYLATGQKKAVDTMTQFQLAMTGQDYAAAIVLYRDTQARSLSGSDSEAAEERNRYKQILNAMETEIGSRLAMIEQSLLNGTALSADDQAFIEGLAEVSSLQLTNFARGLCIQYIKGEVSRPVIDVAINNLLRLDNLQSAIGDIPRQLPLIAEAIKPVQEAETLLAQASWFAAYDAWKKLADTADYGPFVQDFSRQRLADCKAAMYSPLFAAADEFLQNGRYLTAQAKFLELQPIYPEDAAIGQALAACQQNVPAKLEKYYGTIEQLMIKPLIVNPKLAFDGDGYAVAANDTMLTTGEFAKMIEQMYKRNYILIDADKMFTADNQPATLMLPPGKKPFVLVIEGLNYFVSRRQTGNNWNLVLNEKGEVCGQYENTAGEMIVDRNSEAIGILDEFVASHPDFSFDGAKGTLSLSGYEGIFGYITDPDQLDDRNQALAAHGYPVLTMNEADFTREREAAAAIINRLRQTGWIFATSTYGFINCQNANLKTIRQDYSKWLAQVGQLTGPVRILHFPNGALLSGSDPRFAFYKSQGIYLFSGIGANPYQFNGNGYIYVDKVQISGFTLRNSKTYKLSRLFDAAAVYDKKVRP